jgi:hypothetical protein
LETPCLITEQCPLKFVDVKKYIPFAFMWGYGGNIRERVKWFVFGGAYTLSLTMHVSLLHFFRLREKVCDISDVNQGLRVVIALLDICEPRLFHRESCHHMQASDCWLNAG